MIDIYKHKNKLQLESYQSNDILSPAIKDFYNDILMNLNNISFLESRLSALENSLYNMELYLNNKGLQNEYTDFKLFTSTSQNQETIKAFFRKQKIKKILQCSNGDMEEN